MRKHEFKNRMRRRAGFTLSETLIAVLILLMVSAVVAAGVPVAAGVYEKVVRGANAQVLLSTAMTELRDELGTATDVRVENGTTIHYRSGDGSDTTIYLNGGVIYIQEYVGLSDSENFRHPLVSNAAADGELKASYGTVELNDGVLTFSGLVVQKDGNTVANAPTYQVRVLTYVP